MSFSSILHDEFKRVHSKALSDYFRGTADTIRLARYGSILVDIESSLKRIGFTPYNIDDILCGRSVGPLYKYIII